MAFLVSEYILNAAELYGDVGYDRVDEDSWIKYFNAAVRALILVRPDAGATTASVQLVAGVIQTLPAAYLRLLDISRNMGSDGNTAGKIITPTARKHLNYANLLWPAASGDTAIDSFSYDKNNPLRYYVSPPVSSDTDVYVEMVASKLPTTVTATGDASGINDVFFEPIIQYMLFKAFSADDEDVEFQKAITYMQNFFNLVQVEMQTASEAGPENKE